MHKLLLILFASACLISCDDDPASSGDVINEGRVGGEVVSRAYERANGGYGGVEGIDADIIVSLYRESREGVKSDYLLMAAMDYKGLMVFPEKFVIDGAELAYRRDQNSYDTKEISRWKSDTTMRIQYTDLLGHDLDVTARIAPSFGSSERIDTFAIDQDAEIEYTGSLGTTAHYVLSGQAKNGERFSKGARFSDDGRLTISTSVLAQFEANATLELWLNREVLQWFDTPDGLRMSVGSFYRERRQIYVR